MFSQVTTTLQMKNNTIVHKKNCRYFITRCQRVIISEKRKDRLELNKTHRKIKGKAILNCQRRACMAWNGTGSVVFTDDVSEAARNLKSYNFCSHSAKCSKTGLTARHSSKCSKKGENPLFDDAFSFQTVSNQCQGSLTGKGLGINTLLLC